MLEGHVSAIGVLADSGCATTTYPVTISIDAPDQGQLSGVDADVHIITDRVVGVTTDPPRRFVPPGPSIGSQR